MFNSLTKFVFLLLIVYFSSTSNSISGESDDIPKPKSVLIVTPRGETEMEKEFKSEFIKRYKGDVSFSYLRPNVADKNEMNGLASKIRAMKPDLIYTWGTPTTLAVAGKEEMPLIGDIPVFFTVVAYPVKAGLVSNELKPRPKLTGTSHLVPLSIQFEMMSKYKKFKMLGVLYNETEVQTKYMIEDLQEKAKESGISLIFEKVSVDKNGAPMESSIPSKVEALAKRGAEWLYLGPDTFVGYTHRDISTRAALEYGLPVFTANESAVRSSYGLVGVFLKMGKMGKFNAFKAIQLMNAKPGDHLSVDTLRSFDMAVNMCAAEALKMPPPKEIERHADLLTEEKGTCKKP